MSHTGCEDTMSCELCDILLCFEDGHEIDSGNELDHIGLVCDSCHEYHVRECRLCAGQIAGGF